jgi:hypothetical protein
MDQSQSLFSEPSFWVSVLSVIAACVAAWFAYVSTRLSKRALRLSELQEERRSPQLRPYLSEGYCKILRYHQVHAYAFSISLGNPSDIDNALVRAELRIGYTSSNKAYIAVKVPTDDTIAEQLGLDSASILHLPARIDAHQTLAGWLVFRVADDLLATGQIEDYCILFTDTHDAATTLEPVIVRDLIDEEEVKKG